MKVLLANQARKDLKRLPEHIFRKFEFWVKQVIIEGIVKVRKIPGFHDEPLKGDRKGQRSIRLSKSYRAIYQEIDDGLVVWIVEINKHEY